MCFFRRNRRNSSVWEGENGKVYIIFGLGNPGRKYAGTRHNVGFDAVTALVDAYGIKLGETMLKGLLVQPQTFMNNSGECVRAFADFYKVPPEQILVICDDISLEPGKLRLRVKGSAGGHNGLKSIIAHLGTSGFPRLRIGVGEKPFGWDLADHVLARFPKEEEPLIREAFQKVTEEVRLYLNEGAEATMNRFN